MKIGKLYTCSYGNDVRLWSDDLSLFFVGKIENALLLEIANVFHNFFYIKIKTYQKMGLFLLPNGRIGWTTISTSYKEIS